MLKVPSHTQFPNIIIDEYMASMTLAEVKVIMAIVRKTIGWHKISDRISYSQLQEMTGLSVNALKSGIKALVAKKLITAEYTKFGYKYDMNYEGVSTSDRGVSINDRAVSTIDSTKETNVKETNKKEKEQYAPSVNMTEKQHETLIYDYGNSITAEAIEKLSIYKESTGKRYKSDYHTILNWVIKEVTGKDRVTIRAVRKAEREKERKRFENIRLTDEGKPKQKLTLAETRGLIKDIENKMPVI